MSDIGIAVSLIAATVLFGGLGTGLGIFSIAHLIDALNPVNSLERACGYREDSKFKIKWLISCLGVAITLFSILYKIVTFLLF